MSLWVAKPGKKKCVKTDPADSTPFNTVSIDFLPLLSLFSQFCIYLFSFIYLFLAQCLICALKSQSFGSLRALSLTGLLFAVTLQLLCCAAASRLSNYSILLGSASKHISLAILFSVQIKADSNFTKPLSFFHTHTLFCVLWCSPHRYCTGQQELWNSELPPQHTKQLSAIVSVLNESSCQALTFCYFFFIFFFFFYHF